VREMDKASERERERERVRRIGGQAALSGFATARIKAEK
jgi:hypothetical protein